MKIKVSSPYLDAVSIRISDGYLSLSPATGIWWTTAYVHSHLLSLDLVIGDDYAKYMKMITGEFE